MKLTVRTLTDRDFNGIIEGVNHAFLNALRRTLIADVPKLAIEEVTIYDNTSALFDEFVGHRLGLLPIPTDTAAFTFRDECTCEGEGCPNCTVLYTVSKEGPGMVTSGDLTPVDPAFTIRDPDIPIVKLVEGQRVMLEAAAVLGRGSEHAKWQAVQGAGYRELPRVEVKASPALSQDAIDHINRVIPEDVAVVENGKLKIKDEELAYRHLRNLKQVVDMDNVILSVDPNKFVFHFETDGGLHPKDALKSALSILMEKLKATEEASKLKIPEAAR